MANPTNDLAAVLTSGNWIIQYGVERGTRVNAGLWQAKADGWSAEEERGGFVGQGGHAGATGAPPRGPSWELWEFDPDGQIEILDGEMRVERAKLLTTAINSPHVLTAASMSAFRGSLNWPRRVAITGDVDARFAAASMRQRMLDWTIGGDLVMHGADLEALNTNSLAGSIAGTLDMRFSFGRWIYQRNTTIPTIAAHSIDLSFSGALSFVIPNHAGDVRLRGCSNLRELAQPCDVGGDLDLTDTGPVRVFAPEDPTDPWLTVGGDLSLRGSRILELPPVATIGGDVDLRGTRFNRDPLPPGWSVGGTVIQ